MMLDFSVSRIKKIEMESHYKPEDTCHRMFFEWLDGDSDLRGPVTWNTLIWCLKKLELKDDVAETMNSIFDPVCGIVNDSNIIIVCIVIMATTLSYRKLTD